MDRLRRKNSQRARRRGRVRRKITGSALRPRLTIFRSNKYLYLQAVDDHRAQTMAAASTLEKELRTHSANLAGAEVLGQIMGQRLKESGLTQVVFDRNGHRYHGVVKAVADAVRAQGIEF